MKIKDIIIEALTPAQTDKLFKDLGSAYDKNIHDNIFKGKDKIFIDLPAGTSAPTAPQPTQREVQQSIQSIGYEVDDYSAGIAHKSGDPSRKIKIGKLIKDQALLNKFANDPARAATKKNDLVVVISRDPVDVAGMSTDRGWVSCMNLDGGFNKRYVPAEIKNGAIIAYLVRSDDTEINAPVARILMKPYYFKNHMIIVADQVYGTAPKSFTALVNKFVTWANSGSPEGNYKLAKGSYQDREEPTMYHYTTTDSNIKNAVIDKKIAVAANPDTPADILAILVTDKNYTISELVAQNPNTSIDVLKLLAKDERGSIRAAVVDNPKIPMDMLLTLATDPHPSVKLRVAKNPLTPVDILTKLAKNRAYQVRLEVAANPHTPADVLLTLATDHEEIVRTRVAVNRATPAIALTLLAKDRRETIRFRVASNPHTPSDVLQLLSRDGHDDVAKAAYENYHRRKEAAI